MDPFVKLDRWYININQITYIEEHTIGDGGAWVNFALPGIEEGTGSFITLNKDQATRFLAYLDSRDKAVYHIG